jgi:hypothetical protein
MRYKETQEIKGLKIPRAYICVGGVEKYGILCLIQ